MLKSLYESLLENRFDRIGTRTETIYDRGGESVQVRADRKTYNKSDSGMTLIQPYWRKNFKNVLDAVQNSKRSVMDGAFKVPFALTWKEFKEPLSLQIDSETRSVFYRYHVSPFEIRNVEFFFLPGKYKLEFEFHEDKAKFHRHVFEFEVVPDSGPLSLICSPEGCVRG
ncbi:hypothetical protein EHQ12_00870 [Leptospira gomenensis]|uniref:Uncharacterized protein n=1 Tax=Leptospira gomenensis TaxID=2484974 RepID=A0A5F1Y8A7_9LEPT|nr:hypothetical protein EHQ17_16795 [Leptospira gomenensis]TGK45052.1 hypothetical protein EHQ12_00870 [Leptospira gomenensis]TGK51907.1 hypothetical protein EHQ07_01735 [Leptospira gomenensis]TGK67383.1 hypothetical protein EHQ13_02335 [Leptospira gomenensis]